MGCAPSQENVADLKTALMGSFMGAYIRSDADLEEFVQCATLESISPASTGRTANIDVVRNSNASKRFLLIV